jgi:hypothetical protein
MTENKFMLFSYRCGIWPGTASGEKALEIFENREGGYYLDLINIKREVTENVCFTGIL